MHSTKILLASLQEKSLSWRVSRWEYSLRETRGDGAADMPIPIAMSSDHKGTGITKLDIKVYRIFGAKRFIASVV